MKRAELAELLKDCKTLEDFQALGAKIGYKENWAQHVFDARERAEAGQGNDE
jgi:hypothetical protein